MHTAAAPVSYPVAQGGWWRLANASLIGLAASSLLAWLAWHSLLPMLPLLVAAPGGLLVAGLTLRRSVAASRIEWDGLQWRLDGVDAAAGGPRVMMDIGRWMLLHWPARAGGTGASPRWLPVAAADDPSSWHRLRLAMMVPQASDTAGMLGGVPAP